MDEVDSLNQWLEGEDVESVEDFEKEIDACLEWLEGKGYLTDDGEDFAHDYWRYVWKE